jgi:hypothetical protein
MPGSSHDRPLFRVVSRRHGGLTDLLLCLVVTGIAVFSLSAHARAQGAQAGIDCAIQSGPCTKGFAGGTLALEITPRPVRAMHDLTFTVTFSGLKLAHDPFIDLGMPGMIMGPNRVLLKRAGENTYRGTGVIVRCPSGRRTWKATVIVPDKGSAEFVFDVLY